MQTGLNDAPIRCPSIPRSARSRRIHRPSLTLLSAPLVAATACAGGCRHATVEGPAPQLRLEKLLQAPQDAEATWPALHGKVVVLEFWATWCAPCVMAIPHLNELAERFDDRPVAFIAITDEDESIIRPFLKRRPLRGWVALDTDRSAFKACGVSEIPHTVLVDQRGRIVARISPQRLTEAVLTDLLEGRSPQLAGRPPLDTPRATEPHQKAPDDEPSLVEVRITPAATSGSSASLAPGHLEGRGWTLNGLVSHACSEPGRPVLAGGLESTRVIITNPLADKRYDFVVTVPPERDDAVIPLLRRALETAFHVRTEARDTEVYVLTTMPDGPAPGLRQTASTGGAGSQTAPGRASFINFGIERLTDYLEADLGRPVLDETGLDGRYDWELKYDPDEPQSVIQAVRDQLGLQLTPAERPVEFIVVEAREPRVGP